MSLYDLSNPTNAPVLLSSWIVPGGNDNNVGLGSVAFGGNRRYALETNNGLLALRILFPGGATNFTAAPCIHTYTSTTVIGRSLQFHPTNTFFLKRRSNTPTFPPAQPLQFIRFDSSPSTTTLISNPDFYPQVGPLAVDSAKGLAVGILFVGAPTTTGTAPDLLVVYDISNLASPLQIAQYSFPTNHQPNSNLIGQVAFGPDKIFAVDGNNGIIAVPAFPTFLPGLAIARSNDTIVLTWTHSLPEFVLQASPTLSPTIYRFLYQNSLR